MKEVLLSDSALTLYVTLAIIFTIYLPFCFTAGILCRWLSDRYPDLNGDDK